MRRITQNRGLLGTNIEIEIFTDRPKVEAENAIEEAYNKFHYVVDKFSRFKPSSELSKLNKNTGTWFEVSKELFSLIQKALKLSRLSNELFDPTIIDLLKAYGYDKSFDKGRIANHLNNPKFQEEIAILKKKRYSPLDIELRTTTHEIKLKPNQHLDLGAIAKGYAIDLAKDSIRESNFTNFIINAGGDIWAEGEKEVALFDPRDPNTPLGKVKLNSQALAGSGSFARKVGTFHHLLNPKSFQPEKSALQSYVIANTSVDADMYSTFLFLGGQEAIKKIQSKGPKVILILDNQLLGDTNIIH